MTNLSCSILAALLALAGCSRSSPGRADSATTILTASDSGGQPRVEASASGTPGKSGCPRTGLWASCSVETRLRQSGFVVSRMSGEAAPRAGFSVRPIAYTLGRTRAEVFIYPSESAVAADVAKIDTVIVAPRGARNPWMMLPTFVHSGNLAAVFLTENPTQAERFTLALTAGAPQR